MYKYYHQRAASHHLAAGRLHDRRISACIFLAKNTSCIWRRTFRNAVHFNVYNGTCKLDKQRSVYAGQWISGANRRFKRLNLMAKHGFLNYMLQLRILSVIAVYGDISSSLSYRLRKTDSKA